MRRVLANSRSQAAPTTPHPPNQTDSSIYEWFFKNEHNNWIKYGASASSTTSTTSDDIEKHFKANPTTPMDIQSNQNSYTIDFTAMTQTNKKTNVRREVDRRLQNSASAAVSGIHDCANLPQPYLNILLTTSDPGYIRYVALIKNTLPNCNIKKMYRIQNPFLWEAFVNKKNQMSLNSYGIEVNEYHFFHDTDASNVEAICKQNLDWRLHGSRAGTMYGKGAYFAKDAQYSARYSSGTRKVMFIVRVLIGLTAKGNSSMVRPPADSQGRLCDTTVDCVTSPTIFVKYDWQEYYPEYYFEYQ